MNIFLSYSSTRRDLAVRLKLALEAEQHDVFFDRDDLGAGEAYQQAIREALEQADLMLFLVSPESVGPGSYTLAELEMAQAKWQQPSGRVLPVVVAPTPKTSIPPYLLAVTLLEPSGEVVAETLAAVARLSGRGPHQWRRWAPALALGLLVMLGLGGLFGYRQIQSERQAAAEQARQLQALTQSISQAGRLCLDGGYADGFAQLAALAVSVQGVAKTTLHTAQEDCAMAWLRWGRRNPGETSFAQMVAPLRPLLAQGLVAGANGQRAADLRAHLGWADRLVWIDEKNPSIDPTPHFRQAVALDADNVYAHAMWAFWLLARQSGQSGRSEQTASALQHFQQAQKSGRQLSFVRALQLGSLVTSDDLGAEAIRVLNQMRLGREALEPDRLPRIWSRLYSLAYQDDKAAQLLAALPPEEGLQTFLWLFPKERVETSSTPQWRLTHALLLVNAGLPAQARADLLALQKELGASKAGGTLPGAVSKLVAKL